MSRYPRDWGADVEDGKKLKYVEIKPRPKTQLTKELVSSDENIVCDALFSAAQHEPDWRWAQGRCLAMLKHESLVVRSAAIMALGEIAIFRRVIDVDIVVPELQSCLKDPTLAPVAQDALEDITSFLTDGKSIN